MTSLALIQICFHPRSKGYILNTSSFLICPLTLVKLSMEVKLEPACFVTVFILWAYQIESLVCDLILKMHVVWVMVKACMSTDFSQCLCCNFLPSMLISCLMFMHVIAPNFAFHFSGFVFNFSVGFL